MKCSQTPDGGTQHTLVNYHFDGDENRITIPEDLLRELTASIVSDPARISTRLSGARYVSPARAFTGLGSACYVTPARVSMEFGGQEPRVGSGNTRATRRVGLRTSKQATGDSRDRQSDSDHTHRDSGLGAYSREPRYGQFTGAEKSRHNKRLIPFMYNTVHSTTTLRSLCGHNRRISVQSLDLSMCVDPAKPPRAVVSEPDSPRIDCPQSDCVTLEGDLKGQRQTSPRSAKIGHRGTRIFAQDNSREKSLPRLLSSETSSTSRRARVQAKSYPSLPVIDISYNTVRDLLPRSTSQTDDLTQVNPSPGTDKCVRTWLYQ